MQCEKMEDKVVFLGGSVGDFGPFVLLNADLRSEPSSSPSLHHLHHHGCGRTDSSGSERFCPPLTGVSGTEGLWVM